MRFRSFKTPHLATLLVLLSIAGCSDTDPAKSGADSTPLMDVLPLFTADNVPAMGPDEEESPRKWAEGEVTPAEFPGNGLAQHPMLLVGENYTKMFIVNEGKIIWTYQTGKGYEYDDVWMLSNGNILFSRQTYVAMITPDKKTLWRLDCNTDPGPEHTEIHTCQPIGLDRVMIVINGLPPRFQIINIKTGVVEVDHELPFRQPANPKDIHPQFRRARVTADGTYLLPFLNMGVVIEYDKDFNEIWRYAIRTPWAAIRLKNGNTLITNEAESLTREVNPQGETVWELNTKLDLPPEYQFTSAPQTATRLANGNTILASRGRKGEGPQLIEVNPDKEVVWVLQDWKNFNGLTAVQVLDDPGIPEIPGQSEH